MKNDKIFSTIIIIADICLLMLVTLMSYLCLNYFFPHKTDSISSITPILVMYFCSYIASYTFYPSIAMHRMVKSEQIAKRVLSTCSMIFLFLSLFSIMLNPATSIPRTFLIISVTLYAFCLFGERLVIWKAANYIRAQKRNSKNIILVGNDKTIAHLFSIFNVPSYGYNIEGVFFDGEAPSKEMKDIKLGGTNDLYAWLATHSGINEIYGYFPKEQKEYVNMLSKLCDNHLIRFYYVPAIDIFNGSVAFSMVENIPIIARREEPLSQPFNKMCKRLFDIVFSLLVVVLILPWVTIFVSICIYIKSPGPIFFLQERTGLDGKIFKCIKFRSMKVNDQADTLQATKDDPRKFPFGDFMRKTNIDELPQFVNVLKGEMSIVGPRPHMLKHTEEYSKLINHFMVRHLAKPGITGLAQVSGFRGETKYIDQMEGRVKKDIEYIENWTFLLDMKIIIKTVTNVVFRQEKGNAY